MPGLVMVVAHDQVNAGVQAKQYSPNFGNLFAEVPYLLFERLHSGDYRLQPAHRRKQPYLETNKGDQQQANKGQKAAKDVQLGSKQIESPDDEECVATMA